MNSKKTKIILLISFMVFAITTGFFVFVQMEIEKIKTESVSIKQRIEEKRQAIDTFNSLKKNTSDIKDEGDKINSFFIKRDEVVGFLNEIESLASTTKTKISIKAVDDKKMSQDNSMISVSLNAEGTYSSVHQLIRLLEEMPYQTEIQSVNLYNRTITDEKKQTTSNWSADISILGLML